MYMPLIDQLELLKEFGLTFHEAMTADFIYEKVSWVPLWEFDNPEPPFGELLENLPILNYQFHDLHGVWLSNRTFDIDLESYDRPTMYSEIAERLADTTGCRDKLKIIGEQIDFDDAERFGDGVLEYKFQSKKFCHQFRYVGDYLCSRTIIETAQNVASLDDGFQFYGFHPEWMSDGGLTFYYMLESQREQIHATLNLSPWNDYFEDQG